jgi:kumamolisin
MSDQRVPLPGSAPKIADKAGSEPRWSSAVDPNEKTSVTVTLRRRQDSAAAEMEEQLLSGQARSLPREQAAQQLSADPRDMAAVRSFLEQHGLTITSENMAARTLKAEGTVAQMEQAFSTKIGWVEDATGDRRLSYQGPLSIPQSLAGIIMSVIGLDQRPIAKPHSDES